MNTFVKALLAGLAAALLLPTNAASQTAPTYPRKPIKIVVPFDAGGGADAQIRSMTTNLQKELGQPIVIINMAGAGGTIGTADGLRQRGDGYTLVFTGSGPLVTQPFILDLPYNENDYTVISQLSNTPRIIVAHPKAPFNDCKGMMDYAKANPGKVIVGISAVGSTDHFGFEQLKMDHKVEMKLIPQGGEGRRRSPSSAATWKSPPSRRWKRYRRSRRTRSSRWGSWRPSGIPSIPKSRPAPSWDIRS